MKFTRCAIVIALLISLAFPALALAQVVIPDQPRTLSWDELAAHSGLSGLKFKTGKEYQVDVGFDGLWGARVISDIKASIQLTPEEWTRLESGGHPLLNPWTTGKIDLKTWKSTVEFILPTEDKADAEPKAKSFDYEAFSKGATIYSSGRLPRGGNVDVSRLNLNDKAVILCRPDLHSTRLYMLSPNADGKSGVLFYFYVRD